MQAVLFFFIGCMELSHTVDPKRRALHNYGKEMKILAEEYDLSWDYLMALTVLECSGRKPCAHRFEGHVYDQLKQVQRGDLHAYSNILFESIEERSDAEIGHLATSWGPFQIMGYHTIHMGIPIADLSNESALAHGVQWVDTNYGHRLRKEQYEDAFHLHNTGRPFPEDGIPTTYDPDYVYNGLWYMDFFSAYEDARQP
ncbi:MAG: hypothetical protein VX278_13345 [Myxococcota bacterium]|nr:hypothetical protein [Myxococcota bacterium]